MDRHQGISDESLRSRSRIAAHALWDAMVRPTVEHPEQIPWHADAISCEWLTLHLASGIEGAAVERMVVGDGDNGSSVRRRLDLTWNAEGAAAALPMRLFAKVTPSYLTRISSGVAARAEGRVLRKITPQLGVEAPKCLCSGYDRKSGRTVHLFEDLTETSGATFCDFETSINRDQANEIVDTLATLHGSFMQQDEVLGGFPVYERFFDAGARNGIHEAHETAMTQAQGVIPAALQSRREEFWPAMVAARNDHANGPRTLIHSDVHLGNWYITREGHMGLADWACVCTGIWARDFAYALSTTLHIDDRRNWETDLIERYLRRLAANHGITVGFDHALRQVRRQLMTALLMWTPTLCPAPGFPDMQPEAMSMEMIARIATAIDDHAALDAFK